MFLYGINYKEKVESVFDLGSIVKGYKPIEPFDSETTHSFPFPRLLYATLGNALEKILYNLGIGSEKLRVVSALEAFEGKGR